MGSEIREWANGLEYRGIAAEARGASVFAPQKYTEILAR